MDSMSLKDFAAKWTMGLILITAYVFLYMPIVHILFASRYGVKPKLYALSTIINAAVFLAIIVLFMEARNTKTAPVSAAPAAAKQGPWHRCAPSLHRLRHSVMIMRALPMIAQNLDHPAIGNGAMRALHDRALQLLLQRFQLGDTRLNGGQLRLGNRIGSRTGQFTPIPQAEQIASSRKPSARARRINASRCRARGRYSR